MMRTRLGCHRSISRRVSLPPASLRRNRFVLFRIHFDAQVLVFVEQTTVVHLQREWARLARLRIRVNQVHDAFRPHRLRHRHARRSLLRVHQNLHLAPLVIVEFRLDYLRSYHGAVAMLVGGRDNVVPEKFGRRLYDAYNGPKRLWEFPEDNHGNVMFQSPEMWRQIIDFWKANQPRLQIGKHG